MNSRIAFAALLCSVALCLPAPAAPAVPDSAALDAWGEELVAVVQNRDGAAFSQRFNLDTFTARALRNVPGVTPQMAAGFRTGFGPKVGDFLNNLQPEDSFVYLHTRPGGEGHHLIFRLLGESGLNYWDVTVSPDAAGVLKIDDMYFASTGEAISQTMQRLVLRMLSNSDPNDGPSDAELAAIADFSKMGTTAVAGKGDEALLIYDALPEKYQRDKVTQVMRVLAASTCSDPKKLDEVCIDFKRRFGDDPACDLMLIDAFLARKHYESALACADRLDAFVGGDPHLDLLRAGIQREAGMFERAQISGLRAHERDPLSFDAIDMLITVGADLKDFDEMKKWMLFAESDFDFRFADDLNGGEIFTDFKQSPQYKLWLKERPAE